MCFKPRFILPHKLRKGVFNVDHLEIDLLPVGIKRQMRMVKKVAIYAQTCVVFALVVMWSTGVFRNSFTGIVVSIALLLVITPLLLPGFWYEKVSQSTVRLEADRIEILDKKGVCWRTIYGSQIVSVRVEDVSGFFYGSNKHLYHNKYICVFLGESEKIPEVSFARLFSETGFVMFGYHAEALHWIYQNYL